MKKYNVFMTTQMRKGGPVVAAKVMTAGSQKLVANLHRPLTAEGCRQIARDLMAKYGGPFLTYSSSCTWPQDIKPRFQGDVRMYVEGEFNKVKKVKEKVQDSMVRKIIMFCDASREFKRTLTPDERKLFRKSVRKYRKEHGDASARSSARQAVGCR